MTALDPPWDDFRQVVARAVAEDLPAGDPTGQAVGARPARASVVARQAGTVAGLVAAQGVLDEVASLLGTGPAMAQLYAADGDRVEPGAVLGRLEGPADTLLAAERTVLNIVTHLSGVATATAALVAAAAAGAAAAAAGAAAAAAGAAAAAAGAAAAAAGAAAAAAGGAGTGSGAVVRDTRKTLPGLRAVEKYAVRCGGGSNHRMSLSDAVLVKDNHIAALGGVRAAVDAARRAADGKGLAIEVEVDDLAELDEALAAGADLVLVDNMSLADTAEAVRRANQRGAKIEASGGIGLATIGLVAACGVHYIAVGALTHSAPALDIGLDWEM